MRVYCLVVWGRGLSGPYTLHSTPCTLHPTPHTLHHAPQTLHPTPCTLYPSPYILHPLPFTLHPSSHTPHLGGWIEQGVEMIEMQIATRDYKSAYFKCWIEIVRRWRRRARRRTSSARATEIVCNVVRKSQFPYKYVNLFDIY